MILNYIWIAFFLLAFVVALLRVLASYFHVDFISALFSTSGSEVFQQIVNSTFDSSKTALEISIGLIGVMALWLGLLNIGERAGAINFMSRIVGPFFSRLFPGIPKDHPATGHIIMNFSANMLGLGNAATPLGLKAMQSMQELNVDKEKASNAQIMFLVLNTAGFTLLPLTIMVFRAQLSAKDPSDVFIPILLATFFSTFGGVLITAIRQKINLFDRVLLVWIAGIFTVVSLIIYYFSKLDSEHLSLVSKVVSNFILFAVIIAFVFAGFYKKLNVFDVFIEGAKGGFDTAVKIIPYLVAMLVGIAVFRASGAMELLINLIAGGFHLMGVNTDFIPSLPTALMKPLSGSGARGMMIDTMKTYGVDSFAGRLSCIIQGSADTTFYIVALYFGSVGIKNTRYSVTHGLLTDLFGFIAAIILAYFFFT